MKKLIKFLFAVCILVALAYVCYVAYCYHNDKEVHEIVQAMEQLEDMGLSTESMREETQKLYEKYGEKYVKQAEETIKKAVEEAVTTATDDFFTYLKDSITETIDNILHSKSEK